MPFLRFFNSFLGTTILNVVTLGNMSRLSYVLAYIANVAAFCLHCNLDIVKVSLNL